jgi:hypothetical protein
MRGHLEAVRPIELHEIESARERIAGTVLRAASWRVFSTRSISSITDGKSTDRGYAPTSVMGRWTSRNRSVRCRSRPASGWIT